MSFPNGVVPTTERVHPTPVYEFIIWMAIAAFLWRMGTKALRGPKAGGEIFCNYLILTGAARFLIEFTACSSQASLRTSHPPVYLTTRHNFTTGPSMSKLPQFRLWPGQR